MRTVEGRKEEQFSKVQELLEYAEKLRDVELLGFKMLKE